VLQPVLVLTRRSTTAVHRPDRGMSNATSLLPTLAAAEHQDFKLF